MAAFLRKRLGAMLAAAVVAGAGLAGLAIAQSPGSVASELIYAREYMDAGKFDYAQWRYEAILVREPDNAEALAGLAKAKEGRAAKAAPSPAATTTASPAPARGPTAEQMATPANRAGASAKTSAPPAAKTSKAPAAKESPAKAECDRLFGSCYVSSNRSPTCFTQRTLCYNRNGISE